MANVKPLVNNSGEINAIQSGDTVAPTCGGTGLSSFTTGYYINASSSTALQMRSPAQVLSDIGALAATTYTASDILTKLLTVDGTGSLLDADLLDGQQGTYYQDLTNSTGTLPAGRFPVLTGDLTNSSGSLSVSIANSAVSLPKMADVGSGTVFYRRSAGSGVPEVQPLSTLKSDLGINAIEVTVGTARATVAKVGTTTSGTYVPAYGDRINVTFSDGISASSPTLNIDGGGAKNIRLGLTNVSTSLLSTGAGTPVKIPLWYDGTYWQMYGSHLNTTYSSVNLSALQTGTASTGYLTSPLVLTQWKNWFLTDYAKTTDVNAMLAVRPILNRGQGFISWTGEASVTPATGVVLLDSTGVPLSPTKTYKVSACNIDSSAQRGAVALFVGDGTNFTIKNVYEQGTLGSNVQLYLDAGVPTVSVYGGSGTYRIPYIIEEVPNFGQAFSEFAILQRPIDAPSDGTTYGRKDGAWVAVGGGSKVTGTTITGASNTLGSGDLNTLVEYTGTNYGSGVYIPTGLGTHADIINILNAHPYGYDLYLYPQSGVTLYKGGSTVSSVIIKANTLVSVVRMSATNKWLVM